jgi:hypothetical protein
MGESDVTRQNETTGLCLQIGLFLVLVLFVSSEQISSRMFGECSERYAAGSASSTSNSSPAARSACVGGSRS